MSLITLNAAGFDYGREKILDGVNATIFAGVKYALIGDNGAGKTTLLAALAGELDLLAGSRQVTGGTSIRMLRQETVLEVDQGSQRSAYDSVAEAAFGRELELEAALDGVTAALAAGDVAGSERDELVERQGKLQAEFERLDGYSLRPRLETALRGVGLGPDIWSRPLSRLSGGERRRAALAAILLSDADVLLLDEPTNHLDLESCEWLEAFLQQYRGAAVLVSHDRQFLDRVAGRTLHLEAGKLTSFSGNYTFFEKAYRQRRELQLATFNKQQDQIRKAEELIRRTMASGGQKTRQAQSRRKQLARLERVREEKPVAPPPEYNIRLQAARTSGRMVLEATGLGLRFGGQVLFADLDLLVSRGDRIGIIGPNGCGKSSLLRVLSGRELPDAGSVIRGHHVDLGLYDQELRSVADHHTVLEEVAAVDPAASVGEMRTFLGAFGFDEDMVDRPVGRLSGGERGRLALLRLIKEGHNTLLLDEPTNHLDVRCRESLEDALAEFTGTLVVVSHDRRFLDKIVSRLLVFRPEADDGQVRQFAGNYAEFHRRQAQQDDRPAAAEPESDREPARAGKNDRRAAPRAERPRLSKNEQARRRAWIAAAEEEIAGLESEREELLAAMSAGDVPPDRRLELSNRFTEIEGLLAKKLELWEKWNQELAEATERD